jgi:hypothetical protein
MGILFIVFVFIPCDVQYYSWCKNINCYFPLEFEDNLPSKETKPDGSISSAITDDTKNSSPSFGSSVKSQKTDDSYLESESPPSKGRHELYKRTLMLQAENQKYVSFYVPCLFAIVVDIYCCIGIAS